METIEDLFHNLMNRKYEFSSPKRAKIFHEIFTSLRHGSCLAWINKKIENVTQEDWIDLQNIFSRILEDSVWDLSIEDNSHVDDVGIYDFMSVRNSITRVPNLLTFVKINNKIHPKPISNYRQNFYIVLCNAT